MKRLSWILLALSLLVAVVGAQRRPGAGTTDYPQWEFKALLPAEMSPARYRHVSDNEVHSLAAQGWELVSVAPYVYLNEERGPEGRKLAVTQTYSAFYFKRLRATRAGSAGQ